MDELEKKQEGLVEEEAAETGLPEEKAAPEEPSAEEASAEETGEELKIYEPHEKKPAEEPEAVPVLTEEKNPELAPVEPERSVITPAVQYSRSIERERKIAEEVKKRQRRPKILILAMCVVLIVFAIVANAVMRDFSEGNAPAAPVESPLPTLPPASPPVPTVSLGPEAPAESPAVTEAPAVQPQPASRYEVVAADVSWLEAQALCAQRGGSLAVIASQQELDQITAMAEQAGLTKLWLGVHREGGFLLAENNKIVDFWPWAEGEPSGTDSYDGAAEDYVMLWKYNNGWFYNDSRNDPEGEFPQWYSGSIGYVCEYVN